MKVFLMVGMVLVGSLAACGNADELKAAQASVESLKKDNAALKSANTAQSANLAKVTAERDELKAAAEKAAAAPPPAPEPAAKPAAKPKATAKKKK